MKEILVGLNVTDNAGYRQYRDAMKPILNNMGGGFRYDLIVSDVINTDISDNYKNELAPSINRVFIIYFPNDDICEKFFSNEDYIEIKKKYFESAVVSTHILAQWTI